MCSFGRWPGSILFLLCGCATIFVGATVVCAQVDDYVCADTLDPLPAWACALYEHTTATLRWRDASTMDSASRRAAAAGNPIRSPQPPHAMYYPPRRVWNDTVRMLAWATKRRNGMPHGAQPVLVHRALLWLRFNEESGVPSWALVRAYVVDSAGRLHMQLPPIADLLQEDPDTALLPRMFNAAERAPRRSKKAAKVEKQAERGPIRDSVTARVQLPAAVRAHADSIANATVIRVVKPNADADNATPRGMRAYTARPGNFEIDDFLERLPERHGVARIDPDTFFEPSGYVVYENESFVASGVRGRTWRALTNERPNVPGGD